MKAAVAQAMSQVRPQTNLPHDGNKKLCVRVLIPVMEKVFEVPKRKTKGTSSWVRAVIRREDYTFRDCVEHSEIMRHYVLQRMKQGQTGMHKGFPVKLKDEVVPTTDDIYEYHPGMSYRKGTTRPHRDLPFLRGASADGAILALKNNCKYLIRVKGVDMPSGDDWDNFAQVRVLTSIHIRVNTDRNMCYHQHFFGPSINLQLY